MIDTRLTGLLSHAKKYIAYNIFWQWISLLAQIGAVFSIAGLLGQAAILLESKKEEMFFIQGQNTNGLYMGQTYCADNLCGSPFYLRKTGSPGILSGKRGCKAGSSQKDLPENAQSGSFLS